MGATEREVKMRLASLFALLLSAHTWAAEKVYFNVYSDINCTKPLMKHLFPPSLTIENCYVKTYTDPSGKKQTNANGDFDCESDRVTFTQYPGSGNCTPGAAALCINATLSTKCEPVRTHMGLTYQKLL